MLVPVWMGICMASLGEGLCIFTSFNLLDSGIYPLNSFDFYWIYFEWRDTENQRLSPAQQPFSYLSRGSGSNGARPPAEPLHPALPNATEWPPAEGLWFLNEQSLLHLQ